MKILNQVHNNKKCIMHLYLQYPMIICRWVGFFPVEALNQPACEKLRFSLWPPYIIYYTATIIGQFILTGFSLFQLVTRQLTLATLSNFVFYATATSSSVLFLFFAWTYARFLRQAVRLERYLTLEWTKKTSYKSNAVIFIVIGLAIVENILSVVFVMNLVMDCVNDYTLSPKVFKNYFMFRMPHIYKHMSYAIWRAVLLEIANFQATFLWNFTDMFIMCCSLYLKSYCQDFENLVNEMKKKNVGTWEKVRIHYCHLMTLVKLVNTKLCYFVLLSFFIDLYFICLQLFNTLNQGYSGFHRCGQKGLDAALNGVSHSVYYTFSFLFLVLRAMITSLLASSVHAAAKKPIFALRNVASSVYNVEIQRTMDQITYSKLAICGFFFRVTRKMILKVEILKNKILEQVRLPTIILIPAFLEPMSYFEVFLDEDEGIILIDTICLQCGANRRSYGRTSHSHVETDIHSKLKL